MDDDASLRSSRVWAQGTYRVKPNAADEFVRLWLKLARYAVREFGIPPPTIFHERDDPSVFVTFGVWDSLAMLERFRSSQFVAEHASSLNDLIEAADTRLLTEHDAGRHL